MRLLLATHAETAWTLVGRFQGHTEVPLNERGRRQAAVMQRLLAQEPLDAIVASDLSRAWQTAEILAVGHGVPVTAEPRLRELHFGAWEGLTYAEVLQTDAAALTAWQENPFKATPPGGESLADLTLRLQAVLRDLTDRPEATILLVAHRGALRVLLCLLLGAPVERQWEFRLDVASVTELDWRVGPGFPAWPYHQGALRPGWKAWPHDEWLDGTAKLVRLNDQA